MRSRSRLSSPGTLPLWGAHRAQPSLKKDSRAGEEVGAEQWPTPPKGSFPAGSHRPSTLPSLQKAPTTNRGSAQPLGGPSWWTSPQVQPGLAWLTIRVQGQLPEGREHPLQGPPPCLCPGDTDTTSALHPESWNPASRPPWAATCPRAHTGIGGCERAQPPGRDSSEHPQQVTHRTLVQPSNSTSGHTPQTTGAGGRQCARPYSSAAHGRQEGAWLPNPQGAFPPPPRGLLS